MEWTVLKLVNWTADYLKARGIPSARLDAEVLLADTLGYTRVQLYTHFDQPLGPEELTAFKARLSRRAAREPVAYILGRKEFWSLEFAVGPGVLIPRPDTERLVEEAVRLLGPRPRTPVVKRTLPWNAEVARAIQPATPDQADIADGDRTVTPDQVDRTAADRTVTPDQVDRADADRTVTPDQVDRTAGTVTPGQVDRADAGGRAASDGTGGAPGGTAPAGGEAATRGATEPALVLDLCTGSGIIPICIARETGARAIGVDISPEALEFARKNAEKLAPAGQVAMLQGDLTTPVPARFHHRFDLLTANPPYIPAADLEHLEPEIQKYEPHAALAGGSDGLELYRRIAREAPRMLKPGGWVLLEVGTAAQAEEVKRLLAAQGLEALEVLTDLAGQARVVKARMKG